MPPDDAAFASFERKWLEANPEQATVAVFLAPDERRRASAFGVLVHELEQTTFSVREPQVAAVKLNWWRQELISAGAGTPRHPVTKELFDDARARSIAESSWSNLIDGALAQFDGAAASALPDSISTLAAFYRPVASLEAALAADQSARSDADARLWISAHLLHSAVLTVDNRAIPLDLLARHGLARSALTEPSPARAALLRDYLGLVRDEIDAALAQLPQASLGRRVRARLDRELAARASAAADPLALLAGHPRQRRWRSLWLSWREARRSAVSDATRLPGLSQ
ncbi:MAG TPA: squalene/phytoene synthase family protein [Rhodanobacteraceae bacterium]|nr:squalene/phytoene synthase family protein [Rhodanobacteraceae bacterium]